MLNWDQSGTPRNIPIHRKLKPSEINCFKKFYDNTVAAKTTFHVRMFTQALTEKCKDRRSKCNDSLLRIGPAELVPTEATVKWKGHKKRRDHNSEVTAICFLSPGSGGLAFSLAEVDAPPEDAEGWVEMVEDIPSTGKSEFCIQIQQIRHHRTMLCVSNADISPKRCRQNINLLMTNVQ